MNPAGSSSIASSRVSFETLAATMSVDVSFPGSRQRARGSFLSSTFSITSDNGLVVSNLPLICSISLFPLFQYGYGYPAYAHQFSGFIGDPDFPDVRLFSNVNGGRSARHVSFAYGADVVGVDFETHDEMCRGVNATRRSDASQGFSERYGRSAVKKA